MTGGRAETDGRVPTVLSCSGVLRRRDHQGLRLGDQGKGLLEHGPVRDAVHDQAILSFIVKSPQHTLKFNAGLQVLNLRIDKQHLVLVEQFEVGRESPLER